MHKRNDYQTTIKVPLLVVVFVAICVTLAAAACGDDGTGYSTRSALELDSADAGDLDLE